MEERKPVSKFIDTGESEDRDSEPPQEIHDEGSRASGACTRPSDSSTKFARVAARADVADGFARHHMPVRRGTRETVERRVVTYRQRCR